MYKDSINLETALDLEKQGRITIVDASPKSLTTLEPRWRENYNMFRSKHRHISPDKLLTFLSSRYIIEVEMENNNEQGSKTWRYLHGVENTEVKKVQKDDVEYVYVLVNEGYPSLVKIGMTVHDVEKRAHSVSSTGNVEEWVPKFSLPVSKGSALKVEQQVHKHFSKVRVSSNMGNSREFFTLSPFQAFDKVREVGAPFTVGEPIIY